MILLLLFMLEIMLSMTFQYQPRKKKKNMAYRYFCKFLMMKKHWNAFWNKSYRNR